VYRCCKTAQLDLLAVHDVARIGVFPFLWHGSILLGVDQKIEGARLVEERQKSDAGGDLSDDGLDFAVDFFESFFVVRASLLVSSVVGVGVVVLVLARPPVFGIAVVFSVEGHVELPSLQGLARIDPAHDHDEPLNVAVEQPGFHLCHHLGQVFQQSAIGGRQDGETVLRVPLEGFRLVDSALIENRIDGGEEELGNNVDAALEGDLRLCIGAAGHGVSLVLVVAGLGCVGNRFVFEA